MTDREREDLRQAIEILKTSLARTERELILYSHKASDEGFRFLINKATRLKEAMEGFQKQLDES